MISKSTKRNPIIGRKVKTLKDIKNKGGTKINSGEVCTIIYSYRGYSIKSSDGKIITRVNACDITDILQQLLEVGDERV